MPIVRIITLLVLPFTTVGVAADEPPRPAEVTAYEECAVRVFAYSDKVSDVYEECEAQMDAFVTLHDEQLQEKIRHRTMAETQREMRTRNKAEREAKREEREERGKTGG